MSNPQLSVIIPTHNRPRLLPIAVQSALEQTYPDLEVIVVDDASDPPVRLAPDPRLRVIRLEQGVGGAGARNVGTKAARGRWVTYLDDDDRLLPHMAEVSLAALTVALAEQPEAAVGVISGLQKVNSQGQVLKTRIPPARSPQGRDFFLEAIAPGRSYHTKQTLVVERATVLHIGGWDESFRSRVHSEFFLRLNPVCTLIGLPTVTYQLLVHPGTRVSGNAQLRQASFQQLLHKHRAAFERHPVEFAEFVYQHALTSYAVAQPVAALQHLLWALRLQPRYVAGQAVRAAHQQLRHALKRAWARPANALPPS